ncbi:MAG: 6-pyruvoyl tetrahydropterin synthase family protein [Planctomycetes bacterium]|nr:6-pyruvoyl tetrahydropterin synthase family protein [Planctomycetota bacterium]
MPNPRESWSISIEKDYLKFSAAHFLIFPDGTAERLHGHNYKVFVDLHTELDEHGLVVNFKEIKPLVRELCDELDEHLLIPGEHPVLTAEVVGEHYEIRYRERRYLIPKEEVIVLPIGNSSAEYLAAWFGRTLRERMRKVWPGLVVQRLSVGVEETKGQRGTWTLDERG